MSYALKIGSHYDQWLEKELSLGRKCSFFILITNFLATKNRRRGIPSTSRNLFLQDKNEEFLLLINKSFLYNTIYNTKLFLYKLEFGTK